MEDNKRRKKIISGTASLNRRDDKPVVTNGPAGRKDGYQGRRTQGGAKPTGSSAPSGNIFSMFGGAQNQSSQSQNTQNTQSQFTEQQEPQGQNVFSTLGGAGATGGASRGGKLGKIVLIILAVVLIIALASCVFGGCGGCGGCGSMCSSLTDVIDMQSGITQNEGNSGYSQSGITQNEGSSWYSQSSGNDYTQDIGGSETIPDDSVQQGYASDLLAQLFGSSSEDPFDATDNNAPSAVSASTSSDTVSEAVSNKARDRYTTIKGKGKDTVTLMVYLCGSDLESEHSMATADLNEMLHAELDDSKVNIIVETGGAKKWNNSVISNKTNQRYRVTSRGLQILDKNVGKKSMVDPNTLVDFIKYCAKNYPADRYMLIMWDHGGGAISGYGYDQTASGTMTLDKINNALKKGGVKFDFIGFDACLMATLETAVVTEPYADYLIASEEAEPGTGWYYTNWLTELSKNTSIGTVELSKTLIDDFTDVSRKNYPGCNTTLSIVDLAEFAGTVPDAFNDFSGEIGKMLDDKDYKAVADARADAREFGVSAKVNHIDVVDFASRIGSKKANALASALKGCVKYNRTSVSMKNSNGLSIYFPYSSFKSMNNAVAIYDSIGMDADYARCIKSFASLAAGGQIATAGQSSPFGSLFGGYESGASSYSSSDILSTLLGGSTDSGDLLSSLFGGSAPATSSGDFLGSILGGDSYGWFDSGRVLRSGEMYDQNTLTIDDLELTEKGDGYVLKMSDEKWALVESVQLNVFVKDPTGDGYFDLGMDNRYSIKNGELSIEFDNTWLCLNGQVVPFYFIGRVEDGSNWADVGRVPVLINDVRYDLIIVFDNEKEENEYGYVAGAQRVYDNGETENVAKGFTPLKTGDKVDFICDYYSDGGDYQATYKIGQLTVSGALEVGYIDLDDAECDVTYCLTDLYHNEFWTEAITFQ